MNIEGWICTECGVWNSMFRGICRCCNNLFVDENGCTDQMILDEHNKGCEKYIESYGELFYD